jgi:hypothetical protein
VKIRFLITVLLLAGVAAAQKHDYDRGKIMEMNAVQCGYDENGGKGMAGAILGTDSEHKKTREALCPEYTIKAERVTYRVRPKEEKHPALLPVGETAQFRLKKEIMVLKVPEGDDKERDYIVVAITANADAPDPRAAKATANNNQTKSGAK